MTFALHSRIRETTSSTGTGDLVLDGEVTGYAAFSSRYSDGDQMFVGVAVGSEWEIFLGTYNSGADSISRTTMYASTNADSAVDWGAGTKNIFVTNPGRGDLDAVGKSKLATFEAGDMKYRAGTAAHDGWVRANGLTIGSAASGATERANADTEDLFLFLWGVYDNNVAPVSGGRGASAAADFAANKTLTLPDTADRFLASLDDAGGGAKSRITSATQGSDNSGGAETVSIAQANLPAVQINVSGGTNTTGNHSHTYQFRGGTLAVDEGSGNLVWQNASTANTGTDGAHEHTLVGAKTAALGSGTAVNKMPPFIALGTWYYKL